MLSPGGFEYLEYLLKAQGKLGPGKTFWVNGSTTIAEGAIAGSNNNSGSFKEPLATVAYALDNLVTNGRFDNIIIMPNHTEAVIAAAGWDVDSAGLTILGLGTGDLRPIITVGTTAVTTADIDIDAASITFDNLILKMTGVDELVAGLDVNAADFTMKNCRVVCAVTAAQCVKAVLADANADRMKIINCEFIGDTANGTANLECLSIGALTGLYIEGCTFDIIGAADVGPVHFTGAAEQVYIKDSHFANRIASATTCIDCDALAVIADLTNCTFQLGTIATAGSGITPITAASGFVSTFECYVANDQTEAGALVGTASS